MRVKKENKIQELTTMLTFNDPRDHSEVRIFWPTLHIQIT